MLDVEGLSVRYSGRSKPAVSGLSLHVGRGEFVLLAGDSASGKSTAMQAVCGFIPHIIPADCEGTVRMGGVEYRDPETVAGVACMVQQDPETQFCTETVEEEVAFGPENFRFPPERIRLAVDHALEDVGASHLADRRLSTLSGGEKQKVAIASMLAIGPRLLILDEPTASLDPRSVGQVVRAVRRLRKSNSITVIVVEHRVRDFIGMVDRLLVMSEGRLVSDLRSEEIGFEGAKEEATKPPAYTRFLGGLREPAIAIDGLSFKVDGAQILEDVSIRIPERGVVALMGENGSGKTTLLRHIVGLQKVQEGGMSICGHQVTKERPVDPWSLGRDVALVFQNPNHQLFENTVEKEIVFAPTNFSVPLTEAEQAVRSFEKNEGLKRYVHPHCLSFGQKRRVNILSSASHGPKVVLLDEPFAGQDQGNIDRMVAILRDLQASGKTVVVVTHDPHFARTACTDVIVMHQGWVVASGPTDAISSDTWRRLEGGDAL